MKSNKEITDEMERLKKERIDIEEALSHAACLVPGYKEKMLAQYSIVNAKISVLGWVRD